ASVAEAYGLSVGDSYAAVPFWSHINPSPEPVVVGIFERREPDSTFWRVYDDIFAFKSLNFAFAVSVISEATFVDGLAVQMPNMTASYGWTLDIDPDAIDAEGARGVVDALASLEATLRAESNAYRQITGLDTTLADFETRLFFNRLPMIIVLVLVVLVVLYYAITLASLLVDAQREEISLLRTRGASGSQIVAVFVIEAGVLSAVAVAIGPPIAALAIKYAGTLPWFNDLNGGAALPVSLGWEAYRLAMLGGALSFFALFYPALRASRVGLLTHRSRTARASGRSAFQRYYLDVASLGIIVVLLAQLQSRGSVAAENLAGENTVDQITLAIPALFLVVAGLVLLRLFPVTMELLARLLSGRIFYRLVSPTMVLGLWTMARNPAHYSRLSLLFILTAGLGIFAANFGATLDRSGSDQVLYETGADVRVTGVAPRPRQPSADIVARIERIDGVEAVSRVTRRDGVADRAIGVDDFRMIAVDTDTFAEVAWSRSDLYAGSIQQALDKITVNDSPGILLPDDTRFLAMRVRPSQPTPGLRVFAAFRDANGRYSNGSLGTLEPRAENSRLFRCDDRPGPDGEIGWCTIGGSAERVRVVGINIDITPVQPLSLLSLIFSGFASGGAGAFQIPPGTVLIDEIAAVSSDGTVTVIESFDDPAAARWSGTPLLPAAGANDQPIQGAVSLSWGEIEIRGGPTIFAGAQSPPVPVLASSEFLERSGRNIGDVMRASLENQGLVLEIVDEIEFVPTVDPNRDPFIVADIDAVLNATNRLGAFGGNASQFNELWIDTGDADSSVVARLVSAEIERLPYSFSGIVDRDSTLEVLATDPLVRSGWSVLLALAFATVLLVSGVGFLVHSQVTFEARKSEFALLRTIGLSMRQLLSLIVLEQALVLGAAIGIGIFMGTRLGATMLPFLSNSGEGVRVVPPILVEIDWPAFGITFALLAVVILVVVAAILFNVYRMSIQTVLRLGER
ncbi:MAG: FtsX-like permease family protein, partial [Chloroflexi bacterium]|nr:FtsX-like permease family protein [Chloroflexota bacterium]